MTEVIVVDYAGLKLHCPVDQAFALNFDNHYSVYYKRKTPSLLNTLCDKYGSDKGAVATSGHPYPWPSHTYADFIERHFGHCRDHIKNVFECGIGTNNPDLPSSMGPQGKPGASLRVWREYFPKAHIYGADVDRSILFSEERIATFYCDQTDPAAIAAMWTSIPWVEFDLIIDDGLHTFEAGACLFEHSFHRLRSGGIYIIEDVMVGCLIQFKQYFMAKSYDYDFVNLYRKGAPLSDNSLVVIRKP
jgi:hypothetical protein